MAWGGGTIVPGNEDVVIPAYTDTELTVQGDSDLIAGNIRQGIDLFGVLGTLKEGTPGIDFGTITPTSETGTITIEHSLGSNPERAYMIIADKIIDVYRNPTGAMFLSKTPLLYGTMITGTCSIYRTLESGVTGSDDCCITTTENTITIKTTSKVRLEKSSYYWIAVA